MGSQPITTREYYVLCVLAVDDGVRERAAASVHIPGSAESHFSAHAWREGDKMYKYHRQVLVTPHTADAREMLRLQ
jgi:hypothetical protein